MYHGLVTIPHTSARRCCCCRYSSRRKGTIEAGCNDGVEKKNKTRKSAATVMKLKMTSEEASGSCSQTNQTEDRTKTDGKEKEKRG